MTKRDHNELLNAAVQRAAAKWPNINVDAERASMSEWSDLRLATAYLPNSTPDSVFDDMEALYGPAPSDIADRAGLCGVDPLDC